MTVKNFIAAVGSFVVGLIIPFCLLSLFTWQRLARSRFPSRDMQRDWEAFWYQAPQAGIILGAILFFAVLRIRPTLDVGRFHLIWRIFLLSMPAGVRRFSLRPKRESDFTIGEEMFFQFFMIAIVFFVLEIVQVQKIKRMQEIKDGQSELE